MYFFIENYLCSLTYLYTNIYELRAGEYILLLLCKIVLYGHISYVIVVLKNTRGMQIGVELGKIVG